MTTSALGIWTPSDSDDWDLTVDLAATANSIDTVILNQANTINRRNVPSVNSQAERTTLFPTPVQGNRVFRNDFGWEEGYFAAQSVSNPGGSSTPGWYPTGIGPSVIAQRSNLSWSSAGAQASLDGGALLSTSPGITFAPTGGIVVVNQIGQYEVNITTVQVAANSTGQRNVAIQTNGTYLQSTNSNNYGAMSITNGAYLGRFNIRIFSPGQTITPTFTHNSGASLAFTTQVSIKYMGPNQS